MFMIRTTGPIFVRKTEIRFSTTSRRSESFTVVSFSGSLPHRKSFELKGFWMRYFASKDSIGLNQVHPYSINVTTSDMLKERKGDFKRAAEKFYLYGRENKKEIE